MSALPQVIQDTIADWLRSGAIEVFLGYEAGSVPLRATPVFIRQPEEVSRLIWDATCENNLTTFLSKYRGKKVGIMVKGCDARAIIGLLQEGQVIRENLRIVSVHCPGVVNVRRVAQKLGVPVEDIEDARADGETVTVGEERLALSEVQFACCDTCVHHVPTIYDVLMGEPVPDTGDPDPFAQMREMEALSAEDRWARFSQELARCNLCYACRNACPLCYCNICFTDRTMPRWFNQTASVEDKQFYQIIRTFHLAGRCVGCGACTRACPQEINIQMFLDKLRADVVELYGYEAGQDPEAKPPLTTYREDDYNDFML